MTRGSQGADAGWLHDGSTRDPGPCRYQRVRPSGAAGTRLLTVPLGAFARFACTLNPRRAAGALPQEAPEHAARRNKSGLTALRGTHSWICGRAARWSLCCASCVVRTAGAPCDAPYSAPVLAHRLLEDYWLCVTCSSVSCLVPSALRFWISFLE